MRFLSHELKIPLIFFTDNIVNNPCLSTILTRLYIVWVIYITYYQRKNGYYWSFIFCQTKLPCKYLSTFSACVNKMRLDKFSWYQDGRHFEIAACVLNDLPREARGKTATRGGNHRSGPFIQSASYRRLDDPISTHHIQLGLSFYPRATSGYIWHVWMVDIVQLKKSILVHHMEYK